MARSKELEKTQAENGLLNEELSRLNEEGRSLKLQWDEARVAAANAISEYQSS